MPEIEYRGTFTPEGFAELVRLGRSAIARAIKYTAEDVWGNIGREAPVDSGRLAGSFQIEQTEELAWRIYTNVLYALFQQSGTGIYGPTGHPIVPVRANALHFYWKAAGRWMTLSSVRGTPANPYVDRAMDKTRPRADEFASRAIRETLGAAGGVS